MPETLHIDLLRHGETAAGRRFCGSTDTPLTKTGWDQMWSAVEAHAARWDRIVSSPLTRCAAFAHALAQRLQVPYTLDARLGEMHFGLWEGRSAAEIMADDGAALDRFWNDPLQCTPPGAERLAHFAARVQSAWNELASGTAGERVLAITHAGVMRILLCHLRQVPLERSLEFELTLAQWLGVRIAHGRAHLCSEAGAGTA